MEPSGYCETIVRNMKLSNLHYILEENPFSLQITIRKKFIDGQQPLKKLSLITEATSEKFEFEIEDLKKKLKNKTTDAKRLESANLELKGELNDVSDELFNTKIELTKQNGRLKDSLDKGEKLETVAKNFKSEKKVMMKMAEEKFKELNDEIKVKNVEIIQLSEENKKLLETTSTKNSKDVNQNNINCSYSRSSNFVSNSFTAESTATSSNKSPNLDASSTT